MGDQLSKEDYDRQLKIAYLVEIDRLKRQPKKSKPTKNSYWNSLTVDQRKSRLEEARKIKIKEKYEKSLSVFPLGYRLIGIIIFLFSKGFFNSPNI